MGVGTAGNHIENTLMECMVPEASVRATVLLQTGTLLTYSDNIYPSYVRGRYQSSFLSLKRAEPAVGLEPRTSGQDGHGSITASLTLCHCTSQRPVKRNALTHAICMVSDSRVSPRVLGG